MGNYNNKLTITTFKVNIRNPKDWVELFDTDYNGDNGEDSYKYWELSDEIGEDEDYIPLALVEGYETEAERLANTVLSKDLDYEWADEEIIDGVMEKVIGCWGQYIQDYQYNSELIEGNRYKITVAYTT